METVCKLCSSISPLVAEMDFDKAFNHIHEFSNFVLSQIQYHFHSKVQFCYTPLKSKISALLCYHEIVNTTYIAEIAAKTMANPCKSASDYILLELTFEVLVLWDFNNYLKQIGSKNCGKNNKIENNFKKQFPLGPAFPKTSGTLDKFDYL